MAYSLRHIPHWKALEIKLNGKNSSSSYAKFMRFMEEQERVVRPDDFTWLIPQSQLDNFMDQFGFVTTMTQTVGSIKGTEQIQLPDIQYEPKYLDTLSLKPYPFQQIGIAFLVSEKKGIIGDEMGLGN